MQIQISNIVVLGVYLRIFVYFSKTKKGYEILTKQKNLYNFIKYKDKIPIKFNPKGL